MPLIDSGNMPETKIGGMENSTEEYSGDGVADMYILAHKKVHDYH